MPPTSALSCSARSSPLLQWLLCWLSSLIPPRPRHVVAAVVGAAVAASVVAAPISVVAASVAVAPVLVAAARGSLAVAAPALWVPALAARGSSVPVLALRASLRARVLPAWRGPFIPSTPVVSHWHAAPL